MIFQIYDGRMMWQILGWVMVFVGLILINEIARENRRKHLFFCDSCNFDGLFYRNLCWRSTRSGVGA